MKASDLILKLFGWLSISFIIAFLIDNVMQVGFDFPGILTLFKKFSFLAIIELLIYIIIALITIYYVRRKSLSYRVDSIILHNLNLFLIRSFFWIVLIIGIVDITIAFMRVEKFFDLFLSKQFVSNFSRPVFVGLYFQIKLQLKKEQEKFKIKYFDLTKEETETLKKQETYREILAFTNISKI